MAKTPNKTEAISQDTAKQTTTSTKRASSKKSTPKAETKTVPASNENRPKTTAEKSKASRADANGAQVDNTKAASKATTDKTAESTKPTSPEPTPSATPKATEQNATPPKRKSKALPILLGGAVIAGLGYGATRFEQVQTVIKPYLPNFGTSSAEQSAVQTQLETSQAEINRLQNEVAQMREQLQAQSADFNAKFANLENSQSGNGGADLSEPLNALRAQVQQHSDAINSLSSGLDALKSSAGQDGAALQESAQQTMTRAAQSLLSSALQTGAPFDAVLADLENLGVSDIPQALHDLAGSGVSTMPKLQATVSDAARSALAAMPTNTQEGIWGFVKQQLEVRSTTPREGDDVDSILSRVEGAMRSADLKGALAEAQNLPPEAKAAMENWIKQASDRLSALTASQDLMRKLATN